MKSLLVIQPFSISEIVHGLQVIQSLAWVRPDCRITWVVSEEYAGLVQASPYVRETIVFAQEKGWSELFALRQKLKIKMFDAVWDMAGVVRSGLLTSAALALEKWGRSDVSRSAGLFHKQRIALPAGPIPHHSLDVLQFFLRAAGVPQRLFFPLELKAGRPFGWEEFFAHDLRSTFVIFTDNRANGKVWPYFSELTAFILDKLPDSRVAWCAKEKTQPICTVEKARFLNLTGCPLDEMVALLRQPATYIGCDIGPMHLSAALGNPVLAFFAAKEPKETGPYPVDAAKHQSLIAPEGQLDKLRPQAVLAALEELRQRTM